MPTPLVVAAYGLTVISAIGFLHPFLFYPLTLRILPRRPHATTPPSPDPSGSFSLLFCAYNESAVIDAKIENLRALASAWPGLEILAYDDSSTDGTFETLAAEPDLIRVVRGAGRTGKAHGMKVLAAEATGEFLVCTDANVMLDPRGPRGLRRDVRRSRGRWGLRNPRLLRRGEGTSTERVGGAYWRLEEVTKDLESRTGNVMGADGSIFSVRRALYPTFPDTVQDDFTVSMGVVFAGSRLVRRHDALAHETLVSSSSEEFRRKVRIAARAYHTHLHLRPGLKLMDRTDRYKYTSHKLLRWYSASFLALGAVAFAVALGGQFGFLVLGLVVVGAGLLVGLTALVRPGLVRQAKELLLALIATNWGSGAPCAGRRSPPGSRLPAERASPRRGGPPRIDVRDAWMATSTAAKIRA